MNTIDDHEKGQNILRIAKQSMNVKSLKFSQQLTLTLIKRYQEQGENIEKTDEKGCTPLHYACMLASTATIPLLKLGASQFTKDNAGHSPLYYLGDCANTSPACLYDKDFYRRAEIADYINEKWEEEWEDMKTAAIQKLGNDFEIVERYFDFLDDVR